MVRVRLWRSSHVASRLANRPMVSAAVCMLLKHVSVCSLAWLARCSLPDCPDLLCGNFYAVDSVDLSSVHPLSLATPWLVALTLGSLSRRHAFGRHGRIEMLPFQSALRDLRNKSYWTWYFLKDNAVRIPGLVKHRTIQFNKTVAPELKGFCSDLESVVCGEVSRANRAIASG